MALLQIFDLSLYLVTAIVIYIYVGTDVPSPALSAAGSSVVRKVIWGIAIPSKHRSIGPALILTGDWF